MTEEDEAFEDLAKRQGDWGMQGSRKHQIMRYAENVENKGTSMTDKEAMKLALDSLEQMKAKANFECWNLDICDEAIAALKERLAQPEQEPVAWWNNTGTHIDLNVSGRGTPLYTHPPQRVEQKMVMWPCLIDTADFSKGTVTIVMQCEDYKVSAGTHWLSTIPPEENT
jgi:hypothetical protein